MPKYFVLHAFAVGALAALPVAGPLRAETVFTPLNVEAKRGPNVVPNPGFEEVVDGKPAGWDTQLSPAMAVDTQVFHSGKASLRLTKPDSDTRFWVSRTIVLNQTRPAPLVVSAWSKAEGVTDSRGNDYSVWVDLAYVDDTPLWGQRALFEVGTHDWQYAEHAFVVAKPVKSATVNLLFRSRAVGTVWFDDVSLQELQVEGGTLFDGSSVTPSGTVQPVPPATAQVRTGDGLALGLSQDGRVAEFSVAGKPLLGTTPGGFWLRDVAANGPWLRPACTVAMDGQAVKLDGTDAATGLRLEARLEPGAISLDVVATVHDTTGKDRAVTAYFALPLPPGQWTWHDDIVRSVAAGPDSEYKNDQGWPATGSASSYPFCSLTSPDAGLSLGVPMDCPRVCRFVYNSACNVLFVAFDLGLSQETLKFPSRAEVRFSIFHHAPEWGFRAAVKTYQKRFPQFFVQRLKRGGIWMAFADISKIPNFEDFGFAYDEMGGDYAKFDEEHGIASFHYVEPMTYWLPMDKKYPRTYEGAMQALADNEKSQDTATVMWAQLTRRCAAFKRDGLFDLSIENQSWCDGAVFTVNPDPDIAEDAACRLNKGHFSYNKAWADKEVPQKDGGSLHGVYLDSMPNWGEVRNWRREHWRTVDVPLTFDPETKEPVLLQVFSTWEFSKWVADDVHARGGVMHGNGGACWPYFPALLDITGQEMGGMLDDVTMARARTLLGNKPYSPLLNTRFDQLGADIVTDYFNRSLLYCIFPSFFNGTYMQDDKWVTVHYFKEPKFYERDRPLFKKYIPILRRLFDAGWEPVTLARVEPAGVRVERYGPGQTKETLFAVYNPAKSAVTAILSVDAASLVGSGQAKAAALVSDAPLAVTQDAGKFKVTLALPPGTCDVVRLGE